MGSRVYTFDSQTQLSDQSGAITASAAAQVGGSNQIIDFGLNTRIDAQVIIDVSAIDIASTDEAYCFMIQGSASSSFASGIKNLGEMTIGATAGAGMGGAADSLIGRYEFGITNEQADVMYRYVRLYRLISGTTPSITSTAFLSVIPGD